MPTEGENVHDRIRIVFEASHLSQSEFSESIDIRQSHLSGIMKDRNPSRKLLKTISDKWGCNLLWLEHGEGEIWYKRPDVLDPPELANVISETRTLWGELALDERYEVAAVLLREIAKRRKAKEDLGESKRKDSI